MSIKNLMNTGAASAANNNKPDTNTAQSEEPVVALNQPVTPGALINVWNRYAASIEKENGRLFSILTNQQPQLVDTKTILYKLKNQLQEEEVISARNSLMLFLKTELKNSSLELKTEIDNDTANQPQKAFTAADKLQVMMQKNPALALLKQQFNLDID
ncbi:hypothetical protein [Alkaliflexus imshenetskii]|uniref:hypothetical protein n=1 Tax=Alkaliflexus imshenetskii TaxID=286730 RepID=UPI00047DF7C5|nr:hypothetical protein [Alkaliflexus imshenetskii]